VSAIPTIPASIVTLPQLDAWIDAHAANAADFAARRRMMVAVMDRAAEIGARQRGEAEALHRTDAA